ncbi:MAG: efflux transporter outer membrane subunit [Methylocystis sp.]|uniref:efflux transporter outer membrane subunit n=1 Tax=Methylocystis sp. TaxID=1911079 RepID=UPI00394A25EE
MRRRSRKKFGRCISLVSASILSGCNALPGVDLAPAYEPPELIVPASWHGSSPFVEARPSDAEIRTDWWRLFREPVLDRLEMQAMAANPDLQAAAERFVQARDIMMKAQSRLFPRLGLGFGGSDNKQSENALFRAPDSPIHDVSVSDVGIASWEPDFWYAIRNETRAQTYRAERRAAEFALARLSLQAEIASDYFTLRGYDAQVATYKQSIDYYRKSLTIVNEQFEGKIASELDVARAKALLTGTEAKLLEIQGEREVVEHALAILVNTAPASFKVGAAGSFKITPLRIPQKIPSTLLERRPDIAAAEREMAQANREIGIARAAFFPKVEFRLDGGFEDHAMNLLKLTNSFWSYGSMISLPVFEGGLRRAQLQQSWSVYREREDKYRSTVLNAFREVENGLSLTRRLSAAAKKLDETVAANLLTQSLTMDLYRGGLGTSLELIYAQVATLTARIDAIKVKTRLITSSVELVRALGGGWNRGELPADVEIEPFGPLQYQYLSTPLPAGGIAVPPENYPEDNNLTQSPAFQRSPIVRDGTS